jgi:hypothetical protein
MIVYTVSYCYRGMQKEKITLNNAGIFKLKHLYQECFKNILHLSMLLIILTLVIATIIILYTNASIIDHISAIWT